MIFRVHRVLAGLRQRTNGWLFCKPFVHYQCINISLRWMMKCLWQAAHGRETERMPKPDRTLIARYHKIELHGLVSQLYRNLLRVLAHGGGQATPSGGG